MNPVPRPSRAYLICQVVGWGAYGLVGIGMAQAFGYASPAWWPPRCSGPCSAD